MKKNDWNRSKEIEAVMIKFRQGGHAAFEAVFKALYKEFYCYCVSIVQDTAEAEDICIMAFRKLFEKCNEFEAEENIRAFIFVLVRNRSIEYVRSKKMHHLKYSEISNCDIDTSLVDKYKDDGNFKERVLFAIERMPNECKKILKMLIFDSMKPVNVAKELGIAVSTVNNQKFIAIRFLKKHLIKNK